MRKTSRRYHASHAEGLWYVFAWCAAHLNLPPVKIHCSLLAEDAVRLAINNYHSKKPKVEEFEQ